MTMLKMTRDMSAQAQLMVDRQLRSRDVQDDAVLQAMLAVPRHRFVAPPFVHEAYADRALPTDQGQTISQPYIVAKMTELLRVGPGQRVLEVGTGSGYQAAVLAQLGAVVVSIESRQALADRAGEMIESLGVGGQVDIIVGDGTLGCPQRGPFDRIIVTAAAPRLPRALCEQLADGGRIVIPLGDQKLQHLTVVEHNGDHWQRQQFTPCRFVPLVGADGWASSEGDWVDG